MPIINKGINIIILFCKLHLTAWYDLKQMTSVMDFMSCYTNSLCVLL